MSSSRPHEVKFHGSCEQKLTGLELKKKKPALSEALKRVTVGPVRNKTGDIKVNRQGEKRCGGHLSSTQCHCSPLTSHSVINGPFVEPSSFFLLLQVLAPALGELRSASLPPPASPADRPLSPTRAQLLPLQRDGCPPGSRGGWGWGGVSFLPAGPGPPLGSRSQQETKKKRTSYRWR